MLASALASAIAEIGQPEFAQAVLDVVEQFCPFDSALVLHYSPRRRPHVVLDRLSHARRQNSADYYVAGAYLLDPFYIRARTTETPVLLRMRDIAPTDLETSEYYISYYKQSNVVDELNYLIPVAKERIYAISFERSDLWEPFSDTDIEMSARYLPVIAALVSRHFAMPNVYVPSSGTDREHERVEALLRQFGADVLTPRECEVVQRMLNGYSAAAAAAILGVSVETIRVHRRNIYDKLNISSLAELFSMALKSIYDESSPAH